MAPAGVIHAVLVGVNQFELRIGREALRDLQQRIGRQAGVPGDERDEAGLRRAGGGIEALDSLGRGDGGVMPATGVSERRREIAHKMGLPLRMDLGGEGGGQPGELLRRAVLGVHEQGES